MHRLTWELVPPYCSPPAGNGEQAGGSREHSSQRGARLPQENRWKPIVTLDKVQSVNLVNPVLESWSGSHPEAHVPARSLRPGTAVCVACSSAGTSLQELWGTEPFLPQPGSHARVRGDL